MPEFPDKTPFQFSKPLLAILLTTLMLAALLATSTIRNLNREQKIMESFLFDEAMTLIRSFEAGARTTMMHEMMGTDLPIKTLIKETVKASRIAYISIISKDGEVLATGGNHDMTSDSSITKQVFASRKPVTSFVEGEDQDPVFEVAAIFQSLPALQPQRRDKRGNHRRIIKSPQTKMLEEGQAVIHLGLRTGEFIKAREQDLTHSLFMGGLLLLLGSGGFYFLFLYQGMWVTRATLANMKLYTRNIIESMPDGLITLDSKGYIVSCNPRALEFAPLAAKELKGRKPVDLFAGWPTGLLQNGNGVSSFSYTFTHPDGHEIPVEISSSPLLDETGNKLGGVLLLRDLREIRAMEEKLSRSQRLASLGRMAAGIAHEIRNPLSSLRGFAQYLGSKAVDDASKECSVLMVGEVDRLNQSISTLLQFSRPREPEFSLIDMEQLITKTSKLLEYDFKETRITLAASSNCGGALEADGDLLLQVLLNLLKNAIAASQADDTVTLSCVEDDNGMLRITVTDEGSGMTLQEQEQMFDPFFTTRKSGTGLGLAVSHQIIEQHQGTFMVQSSPGKGSSITLILPRRQKQEN